MKIVATTALPAVDRPNADRWNAARSRQKRNKIMTFIVATNGIASQPPERRLTGTLKARAKIIWKALKVNFRAQNKQFVSLKTMCTVYTSEVFLLPT